MNLTSIARPHMRVPVTRRFEDTVLLPSLLAWWKADEAVGATTMLDYSGNGHHAAYNLTANLTQHVAPLRTGSNGCLQTTGNTYAASIASTGITIGAASGDNWTLSCIVHKNTGGGSVLQKIWGYGPGNVVNEFGPAQGYRTSASNGWYVYPTTNTATRLFSPNSTTGTTLMIHAVKSSASGYDLYENGTLVSSQTLAYGGQTYSDIEFMGTSAFPGSYGFIGLGSDFLIYSSALTAAQIHVQAQAAGFA